MEQETAEQKEYRVITGSLDNYIERYKAAATDDERAKNDVEVIELLSLLAGKNYVKYWDYYEKGKES